MKLILTPNEMIKYLLEFIILDCKLSRENKFGSFYLANTSESSPMNDRVGRKIIYRTTSTVCK